MLYIFTFVVVRFLFSLHCHSVRELIQFDVSTAVLPYAQETVSKIQNYDSQPSSSFSDAFTLPSP